MNNAVSYVLLFPLIIMFYIVIPCFVNPATTVPFASASMPPLHIHCLYPQIYVRMGETRADKGNDRNQGKSAGFCLPTARKYQLDVKLGAWAINVHNFQCGIRSYGLLTKSAKVPTSLVREMPRQTPGNQRTRLNFPTVDSAKFCFPDVRVGGFEYFNHHRRLPTSFSNL